MFLCLLMLKLAHLKQKTKIYVRIGNYLFAHQIFDGQSDGYRISMINPQTVRCCQVYH